MKKKAIIGVSSFIGLILLILIYMILFPPIEGYYRSDAVTYHDCGNGYLHLKDGKIYIVNYKTETKKIREEIGRYEKADRRKINIHFTSISGRINSILYAKIGLFAFKWPEAMVYEEPDEYRVWNPFLKRKLDNIELHVCAKCDLPIRTQKKLCNKCDEPDDIELYLADYWFVKGTKNAEEVVEEKYSFTETEVDTVEAWVKEGVEIEWPDDCIVVVEGILNKGYLRLINSMKDYGVIYYNKKYYKTASNKEIVDFAGQLRMRFENFKAKFQKKAIN